MPEKIDYKFLSEREGGSRTIGYVPAAGVSRSGVTIATGFDLGQRNEADLKKLGLSLPLLNKLKPYLGKKSKDAQSAIKNTLLTISDAQALEVDKAVKKQHIALVKQKYNFAVGAKKKFDDIPGEAQTVIVSVSFQYGAGLDVKTPKFWKSAVGQNWQECIKLLNNFGDAYPSRRKLEAGLLGKIK